MDKEILKQVIADNQLEIPNYEIVKRNFTFEEFGNYVFVGVRRAGKSFLLYQRIQQLLAQGVKWDELLYINFEDERLTGMATGDLNLLLEVHLEMYGKKPVLFLDELQNIAGWEKFARRLADTKHTLINKRKSRSVEAVQQLFLLRRFSGRCGAYVKTGLFNKRILIMPKMRG